VESPERIRRVDFAGTSPRVQAYIRELLLPFEPAVFHFFIPRFRWRAIATTNFDLIHAKSIDLGVATDAEFEAMSEVLRREAPLTLGLSTGLVYNPAVYSDQREITALVRAFNQVSAGCGQRA